MKIGAVLILILIIMTIQGYPQDAHYWTNQYGSRSRLLGGSVIGSVNDLAAVYYNPARLALIPDPGLLLSARIYQFTRNTVKDGLGQGIDLNNESFGGAPGFAAGMSRRPGNDHAFGYTYFNRVRSRVPFTTRRDGLFDIVRSAPGDEFYAVEYKSTNDINDRWYGVTWSWKRWQKSSIGISTFLSYRSQRNELRFLAEALTESGDIAAVQKIGEFNYKTWDLIWKLGYSLSMGNWSVGATLTTPRLNLAGSGSTLLNNLKVGVSEDTLEVDYQRNLDAQYKAPVSLAVGAGFMLKDHRWHVSAEWFSEVGESIVMSPEPFFGQSTGDTLDYTILQEANPVLNLGIGYEWYFAANISLYGSFTTDFSAATADLSRIMEDPFHLYTTNNRMNIYHAGVGIGLLLKNWELTVGTMFSFGNYQIEQLITLPPEGGIELPSNEQENIARAEFRQLRFLLGISFDL